MVNDDRLDQTLGKPSIWMASSEREKQRMTVLSRMSRVEMQVSYSLQQPSNALLGTAAHFACIVIDPVYAICSAFLPFLFQNLHDTGGCPELV